MSIIRQLASRYRLRLLGGRAFRPHEHISSHHAGIAAVHHRLQYMTSQRQNFEQNGRNSAPETKKERSKNPPSPLPRFALPDWVKWALGTVLTLILPFWDNKWKSLLKLEGEVQMAEEVVETAADIVEKVATVAESVSSEVAERLPEDGKLKEAVLIVESVAKEAAQEARITKDIIHKVDELKQDVGLLLQPLLEPQKHSDRNESHQQ